MSRASAFSALDVWRTPPMPARDTGFHPSDPDWTRGRAQAIADAEAIARRQTGMQRAVKMKDTPDA